MDENTQSTGRQPQEYYDEHAEVLARRPSKDTLAIVREMQKREATASSVYKFLARRVNGRGGEMLMRVASEKAVNAERLEQYTEKKGKASFLSVCGWRLLSLVFGSSFVISRLEAGEAEARTYFSTTARDIPDALVVSESGERHRIQLREVINQEGLRGIGSIVTGLYSAVLLIVGSLAGFITVFNDKRAAAVAGFCAAAAAVFAAAATGWSSQKAATGRQHPGAAAFTALITAIAASVLILSPFFFAGGAWTALAFSILAVAVVLALLAFFAAVVRQEAYFVVFIEMLFMTIGAALLSLCVVWFAKTWFGLHV